jgi:biotin carboxylase
MTELLLMGIGVTGRPYLDACDRLRVGVRAIETADVLAELGDRLVGGHPTAGQLDEAWAAAADAAVAARRPDGVVAFADPQVLGAALVQDQLDLPGPSLPAAVLSRNKALQRGRFAARALPQPDHVLTDDLGAVAGWVAERLPVVVKPLSATGSLGVELVSNAADYREVCRRRGAEGTLLVERYADGPEYSWEGLVEDGRIWFGNVTAKETTGPPGFVELVHRAAAELSGQTARQVARLAAGTVAALGMRTGIVHLEFRLGAAGPRLLEVAVRTPGDRLLDVLELTYGFSWYEMVVRLALRMPLPPPPTGPPDRYAASCYLTARPGVLTAVEGLDEVRAHPAVVRARVRLRPGQTVHPLRSSADRVGNVLLQAGSRGELEEAVAYARRTVRVLTAPAAGPA